MKFIFPIAGIGKRFIDKSDSKPEYKKPKPLIDVRGLPMIKRAVDAFPADGEDIIFIVRKEHINEFEIDKELKKLFSEKIKIVIQNTPPEGAAKSALLAKSLIDREEELIISDCDFILDTKKFFEEINEKKPDFAFPIFKTNNPRSSFAKLDSKNNVIETAEKQLISDKGIIGTYYFRNGSYFEDYAEKMISCSDKINNEFYISPIFNYLIKDKKQGIAIEGCKLIEMGTPELLEKSLPEIREKDALEIMKKAVKEAGKHAMQHYGKEDYKIKNVEGQGYEGFDKIKKSFVTNVDKEAEKIILHNLREFTDFAVLAEEEDAEIKELASKFNPNSEYAFLIDPLDGTSNYLMGNKKIKDLLAEKYLLENHEVMPDNSDKFGVCISLLKKGSIICTVVYYPYFGQLLVSEKGSGTWIDEKNIRIKKKIKHEFSDAIRISQYSKINKFKSLFSDRKSYQSASYNLKALLEGKIIAYCIESVDYLDFCPTLLAYKEAGGFISDEKGSELSIKDITNQVKDNRINQFMILCPTREYLKSFINNLKSHGFDTPCKFK